MKFFTVRHIHDHYHHHPDLAEVKAGLSDIADLITNLTEIIMATQAEVKAKLDALTADVADETTQIAGIEQVLDNLAAIITALRDAATNADVPQAIVDQIDALGAAVGGNKARIIADIQKGTPPA